jgi:serine/threonine protein kinase
MSKLSYIAMERLGKTLQHYLYDKNRAFSLKSVCQIGIQILTCLQKLHGIGFLHNDLKLENVLVGNSDGEDLSTMKLIDFGLCKPYLDDDGKHVKPGFSLFCGNLAFCSVNAMLNKILSRRDDLISLVYMLLYLH